MLWVDMLEHWRKTTWGGKALFDITAHDEGKPGQELTAGTRRQELKQRPWGTTPYWLLLYGLLSLLFYIPQNYMPMAGTTHGRLGPPTQIMNQENIPQTCPQTIVMEAFFLFRVLLPRWLQLVSSYQQTSQHTLSCKVYDRHWNHIC